MGGALRAALMGGFATTLVVGGLVALPSAPAVAVTTGRPIAVAAADNGTSYVGYAAGGRLLKLDSNGTITGTVPLDRDDEPVTALDVGSDGTIWVDYGASVSRPEAGRHGADPLRPAGRRLSRQRGARPDALRRHRGHQGRGVRRGRCVATVGIYGLDGDFEAGIDLPGTSLPRDVALAPAAKGLPARMYVSLPDAGKVYAYNTASLRSDPEPAKTLVIKRFPGFRDPEPGALTADEKGQLGVVDIENNALHFYNGPENYWYYRTLGHGPDPASDRGYVDRITAVDNADGSFKQGSGWPTPATAGSSTGTTSAPPTG